MDISLEMLGLVVALTILGLLFTGPGMWSERWGWKWLGGGEQKKSGGTPSDKPK